MNLTLAETVSDLVKNATSNKFLVLAADLQKNSGNAAHESSIPPSPSELKELKENILALDHNSFPLVGESSEILVGDKWNAMPLENLEVVDHHLWEQLGEHHIIMGKTVLAIYEKL